MKEYLDIERIVNYEYTPSLSQNACSKSSSHLEEFWTAEIFEDEGGADDFEQGIIS